MERYIHNQKHLTEISKSEKFKKFMFSIFYFYHKEDEDEEESYLRRLDGGLFILQLVDYVLLEACTGCPPAVKQRVTRILAQRRASLKTIRHIMRGK